jgi:hypothetical protein
MRKLLIACLLTLCLADAAAAQVGRRLPARFEADRIFLDETTADGRPIVFFTDSGGGRAVSSEAAARLGLSLAPVPGAREGGPTHLASYPALAADSPTGPLPDGQLPVLNGAPIPGWRWDYDVMLGADWFADRIWTFDYPGGRLTAEEASWRPSADAVVLPLGFQVKDGHRTTHFPRIEIRIGDEVLAVLLDTGATTALTPEALVAVNDEGPSMRATSMISDSVFRSWRAAHPEWRVVEAAQIGTGSAMIEVPTVEIGGLSVGPVWFTHRPDAAFRGFMSSMMDAPVEGALGGNALSDLVMTIDYSGARAVFSRPGEGTSMRD